MSKQLKVVLDGSSAEWSDVFRNSPEIREGLERYASMAAAKNTAALQASGSEGGFTVSIVDAGHSQIAKVIATGQKAKKDAIKAGLPHW